MTREDFESITPGTLLKIGPRFVEDPHEDIRKFLGSIQELERADLSGTGWAYFNGIPQPFAFSEVECVVYSVPELDLEPYQVGDIHLILGEV